jgi:hypothetical protein
MADYIPLFLDWARSTEGLSDAEKGRLVDAMVAYATGEDWQNLIKGNERFVMNVFRGVIDRHNEKQTVNKVNGSKGGRPRKIDGFGMETEGFNVETDAFDEKGNNNKNNNNNENNNKNKGVTVRATRFIPPTAAEVTAYCAEKGYRIDAERFVAYYESNGWRVGKNPMKDWRAAVRTWTRNDAGYSAPQTAAMSASDKARAFLALAREDGDGA